MQIHGILRLTAIVFSVSPAPWRDRVAGCPLNAAGRAIKRTLLLPAILTWILTVLPTGSAWADENTMTWLSLLLGTKTGYLIDSGVSGVGYTTPARTGITGPDGSFRYGSRGTVRFFLGQTVLGECVGRKRVSPFDLIANATVPIGNNQIWKMFEKKNAPLWGVINQAVLLQTLDDDGDPANGIAISSQVAALFNDVSINFIQSPWKFRRNPSFRGILNQANSGGLFPATRTVRNWGLAMNHLYQALGVDPRIFGRLVWQRDINADGAPDEIRTTQYNASGIMTRIEFDNDGDGTPNSTYAYQYDANGNQTRTEYDSDGDGSPNSISTFQYDANGNQTRYETDNNADGTPDSITSYQFDAYGNPTRYENDNNADGTPDFITTFQYDANGNQTRYEYDNDGDGSPNSVSTYQYDANGNQTRLEIDENMDLTPDFIDIQQYDANGNRTWHEVDNDGIAPPDYIDTYQYDAGDNEIRYEHDIGGNNTADSIKTYQYDANGNRIRYEDDSDANGVPDTITTYQYDANNNRILEEIDTGGDGSVNERITSTYQQVGWSYIYD